MRSNVFERSRWSIDLIRTRTGFYSGGGRTVSTPYSENGTFPLSLSEFYFFRRDLDGGSVANGIAEPKRV